MKFKVSITKREAYTKRGIDLESLINLIGFKMPNIAALAISETKLVSTEPATSWPLYN